MSSHPLHSVMTITRFHCKQKYFAGKMTLLFKFVITIIPNFDNLAYRERKKTINYLFRIKMTAFDSEVTVQYSTKFNL